MDDHWPHKHLKEITLKIGSGATPRGGKNSYKANGISLIRSLNVYDFSFDYDGLAFIDDNQADVLDNVKVERKDILLNITGASVARCCMVPDRVLPARVNQHVSIVRVDPNLADSHFVLYVINSPKYKNHLFILAQGGATREALTKETIEKFQIPFPPLPTQRKIAAILSAYDDLIENNRRRIQILEEMAQAIYREWFVHYRFPGHELVKLVDSGTELGMVPEGWEVKKVNELIKRLPKRTVYIDDEVIEKGDVIVYDQSQSDYLGFHNNNPDFIASTDNPIAIFGDHTCKMRLIIQPFSIGPNVVPFQSKENHPLIYIFYLINGLINTQEYKRHWNELIGKTVPVATYDLARKYSDLLKPLLGQQNVLRNSNNVLKESRDLLLPRLINGELDVSELEIPTA